MSKQQKLRRIVMQKVVNGMPFHLTEDFDFDARVEPWIRSQEEDGYKLVANKVIEPEIAGKRS